MSKFHLRRANLWRMRACQSKAQIRKVISTCASISSSPHSSNWRQNSVLSPHFKPVKHTETKNKSNPREIKYWNANNLPTLYSNINYKWVKNPRKLLLVERILLFIMYEQQTSSHAQKFAAIRTILRFHSKYTNTHTIFNYSTII